MSKNVAAYGRTGKPLDFPVFDMHVHHGTWAFFDAISIDEEIAEMDRVGVRVAAISSLPAIAGNIREGNDGVAALLRLHPSRFVGYVHVNANYPALMLPEIERCFAQPGFRGIKVYQQGVSYDDARFEPVWEFPEARRAPVLAHTWGGNLTGFDKVAQRHPRTAFFAAHAGSDFQSRPYIEAARLARNFYLDLTYSRDHANMLEHFVHEIGAAQIVWGTDQPLFSMAQQASKVLFARISDDDKKRILGGTAYQLFGMTPD
jgi:uncharacterized protein